MISPGQIRRIIEESADPASGDPQPSTHLDAAAAAVREGHPDVASAHALIAIAGILGDLLVELVIIRGTLRR